ncbi:retrovirus-related pol polyprotein from transposon TNT 1-94 [Tanacetum coccineum]
MIAGKPKFQSNSTPQHNQSVDNHQKDYKRKYKGLKAEIVILTKKINSLSKGKSKKGLVGESFDKDEESVSSEDKGVTMVKAFMAIAEEEPYVGKNDVRSGQWVEITMKKVQRLLFMTDGDERRHVLDYTHVDLHYVEDQRKNLLSKFNSLNQELSLYKSELADLKNGKALNCSLQNTSSKVILDQLLTEQVPGNIVRALEGRGKKKDTVSSKEVLFSKEFESSSKTVPEVTSDSESECENLEPLPHLPKLTKVEHIEIKKVPDKRSAVKAPKIKAQTASPSAPDPIAIKKADSFTEKLLLILNLPKANKRPGLDLVNTGSSLRKAPTIPKPFIDCKYCGFNNHHSDECEYYPGCDIYGRIAHETADYTKKPTSTKRKLRIASQRSNEPTEKSKVVFRDNSLGDTEEYGSVNCNGITFTKIENLNEVKVKELRSDNGTEFRNHKLEEFYDENGISHLFGDEINFNENRSFPDDECLVPRIKVSQYSGNDDYSPYVSAHDPLSINNISIPDNVTPLDSPILQDLNSSDEQPEFTIADDHLVLNEHDDYESVEDLGIAEDQVSTIIEPVKNDEPSPTIISPSTEVFINPLIPQDRWSREKHIELIKPKKLIEALEEEGWIIAMQEALNQFERNKIWKNKMDEHGVVVKNKARLVAQGYNQQEEIDYDETFAHVARLEASLHSASVKCLMLPPNNLGPDELGVSVDETLFRGIIGSLMYLTASRPDIQFSTCLYTRYQANPKESHLVAVKRISMYLKGTPNIGLWYPKGSGFDLKAYSDSDHARCNLDRKSTSGGFQIQEAKLSGYVPIFYDNISVIAISNNLVLHSRTKHIDIRYHFIRDHILKGDIELHFLPTELQLADIFMKPLAEPSFTRLVTELGMLNTEKDVPVKKKILSNPLT